MCGIAGIIKFNAQTSESELKKMTDALVHRGPDDEGIWLNENKNIGLGHRRLSIIDTSSKAHQPMVSDNHQFVLTFNGEIYNYIELRSELIQKGHHFKTENDTEVLLKMYAVYGYGCLNKLDGMFAFAIYDNLKQELFCARDRFGEKPFYYSCNHNQFAFASEMKALWQIGISQKLNEQMLYNYEFYGYKTNPENHAQTFFNDIQALPASHFLVLKNNKISIKSYYTINLQDQFENPNQDEIALSLKSMLSDSINKRLRSQVTVGSSFSGGLDSSIIVNEIYNSETFNKKNLNVFSAIFPNTLKDESKYIQLFLSDKPDIKSHLIIPNEDEYQQTIDKLIYHHEEPFTSTSVLAQYFVYQRARKENVIVLLDGQGADEVFGGYHAYFHTYFKSLFETNKKLYKQQLKLYLNKNQKNQVNTSINAGLLKQYVTKYLPSLLNYKRNNNLLQNIPKNRLSYFKENQRLKFHVKTNFKTLNEELHYQTFQLGLPALLRYADRNSMANSIEVRLPFLSHKLVELMFQLPDNYKINDGYTKWLLRYTYSENLHHEICYRKEKIGLEPGFNHNFDLNHANALNKFIKIHS